MIDFVIPLAVKYCICHEGEHNGFMSALFRHTARCHNESMFLLSFKMAVVHVSHMINAAPLVADNARDESIQQKVRSYPQRSNLLDDDFKYASSVSSGSSKLTSKPLPTCNSSFSIVTTPTYMSDCFSWQIIFVVVFERSEE